MDYEKIEQRNINETHNFQDRLFFFSFSPYTQIPKKKELGESLYLVFISAMDEPSASFSSTSFLSPLKILI